ncbi:hypothetical protein M404DRAFT_9026 [Pisolithus tinctorius Marx 270]|uniref:Uncharacterized protein n=1 Tax=Pisolithus tinctorius Marx 270 TaxID=870435 RepID=A0A0C3J8B1_PISTI|nr:hypothetical protein M404DRAFT_9026 [Pisolithus tinctorius Marx 270]
MYSRKPYDGTSRKLILAFDVGTTFSGISYCIVDPGEIPVIRGVSKFPAQEHVGGSNKIPSIMYYDKGGKVQAVGAETQQPRIIEKASKEEWVLLECQDVAKLFEPSVEEIIAAFEVQRKAASMPITCVFLVGGYAASDWLHSSLLKHMSSLGVTFCRPSQHVNKAVADGAVSYYLDRLVSARAARFTYGIPCCHTYTPHDTEHASRRLTAFTTLSGDLWLPNGFCPILTRVPSEFKFFFFAKGTEVSEQQEFRRTFYREQANLYECKNVGVDIVAYRGTLENPLWMDKEAGDFKHYYNKYFHLIGLNGNFLKNCALNCVS